MRRLGVGLLHGRLGGSTDGTHRSQRSELGRRPGSGDRSRTYTLSPSQNLLSHTTSARVHFLCQNGEDIRIARRGDGIYLRGRTLESGGRRSPPSPALTPTDTKEEGLDGREEDIPAPR